MTLLYFMAGLVALIAGANLLVRGASKLALRFGISPLVIGLTVVAFGTSAPELAVSVRSAYAGQVDMALGNVVGSNIFNILFILGASALITPLVVNQQLIRQEVPIMLGVALLLLPIALDGAVSRLDAALLCGLLLSYTLFLVWQSRKQQGLSDEYEQSINKRNRSNQNPWVHASLVLAGLVLLVVRSTWLVQAAIAVATFLGLSEMVIGLTIVAAGTSLPEVATSITAALRGQRDIAVGNVVGSSTFNILGVLGASALVAPQGLTVAPALIAFDIPVMIAVSVACLPIFFTGNVISRWEGAVFLGYYLAYTTYLVLAAKAHDALSTFSLAMTTVVLPFTLLTVAVVAWREWLYRRG